MLARYLCLLLVVLISACGGSSDSNDSDSATGDANVIGQVVDAVNAAPLPDVQVTVEGRSLTAITGSDGRYELGSFESDDDIDLSFALEGYRNEIYASPTLSDATNQLDVVRLVPDDNAGSGGIGGTITDSQGNLLAGVLLRFFAGINVVEGTADATTTTDLLGLWAVTGLDAGNYTCVILVDGEEPIYETVQILGGIESVDADVVVSVAQSQEPTENPVEIDFPAASVYNEYGSEEVTWSYGAFNYEATSGIYSVDRIEETGMITLAHTIGPDLNPLNWRDSRVFIRHTFAGPGVYPLVGSLDELEDAAEQGQAAARVSLNASGPRGPVGFDRLDIYLSSYIAEEGQGSVSVTVDNDGRYRFDIGGLAMKLGLVSPDAVHPDAPESIELNLSNGYVP